jgi:hypothetical protein
MQANEGGKMRLSERDRAILADIHAEKIDSLRPMVGMPGWREAFEKQARALEVRGRGFRTGDPAADEFFSWSVAHRLLLDEQSSSHASERGRKNDG